MKEVGVLTDLICEIPDELLKGVEIGFVQGHIHLANGSYNEQNIPRVLLRSSLLRSTILPKTSAPNPYDFLNCYKERLDHSKAVFSVHISGELAGTVSNAKLSTSLENLPVEIFDSRTMGMGTGFIALAASRIANLGGNMLEVVQAAQNTQEHVGIGIIAYPQHPMIESKRLPGLEERTAGKTVFMFIDNGVMKIGDSCDNSDDALDTLIEWLKNSIANTRIKLAVASDWRIGYEENHRLIEKIKSHIKVGSIYMSPESPIYAIHLGKAMRFAYLIDEA